MSKLSELNPIEMLRAFIKVCVSQYYSRETTMEDIGERLSQKFGHLATDSGADTISRKIVHVYVALVKILEQISEDEYNQSENSQYETNESTEADTDEASTE